jgi:hypothetical protein
MIKSKLGFIRGEGISDNSEDETETNETEINEDNEEEINEDSETEIETEINEEGINEGINEEGIKEDIDEEVNEEDINEGVNQGDNKKVIVSKENRISDGFISEYEYVRVLSIRSKQIMLGGKIMLKNGEELRKRMSPREIAEMEIKGKCCPLIIVREMCNGTVERWSVNELEVLY